MKGKKKFKSPEELKMIEGSRQETDQLKRIEKQKEAEKNKQKDKQ